MGGSSLLFGVDRQTRQFSIVLRPFLRGADAPHLSTTQEFAVATILVIDDDAATRRLILRVLKPTKHTLLEAENGEDGLLVLAKHDADLVITDLLMPKKEGIATMREIRQRAPATKFIAITGGGTGRDPSFLNVARAMGADAALAKPFRPRELIEAVARLLPTG
jgi:CheY-like chemotaxis protein